MEFPEIERLKERLTAPLPGIEAQKMMMPVVPDLSRFEISKRKNSVQGGVLILIYPQHNELYIPLMLRPEYGGPHSGQVSLPGGRIEDTDEDLVQTALREAHEELGIPSEKVIVAGNLTELFIIASNFTVLPVIGIMDERPEFQSDPREVAELIETPISLLLNAEIVKSRPFNVRGGIQIDAPYFDIFGHHVWGATAMILSEFLTVYRDL